jgi:hypothetical protein
MIDRMFGARPLHASASAIGSPAARIPVATIKATTIKTT